MYNSHIIYTICNVYIKLRETAVSGRVDSVGLFLFRPVLRKYQSNHKQKKITLSTTTKSSGTKSCYFSNRIKNKDKKFTKNKNKEFIKVATCPYLMCLYINELHAVR